MEAEEFIKSKGLDINHYVIIDMSYNYRSQIPICIWLDEFAEQQNKELIEEIQMKDIQLTEAMNTLSILRKNANISESEPDSFAAHLRNSD